MMIWNCKYERKLKSYRHWPSNDLIYFNEAITMKYLVKPSTVLVKICDVNTRFPLF